MLTRSQFDGVTLAVLMLFYTIWLHSATFRARLVMRGGFGLRSAVAPTVSTTLTSGQSQPLS
ncbi:hypothetical protein BJY01DRAFT_217136 [Aspergillus pseudoustus]|uniref:Uncharacterized protein n=1 Tax=Aspergillus pseudoustus TaxID=1810923 RepID=A0ABR4JNV4_9EURO